MVGWELICQWNQTKVNKNNIHENIKRGDHDYKVGDKIVLDNNASFGYETPYKGPFEI